MKLALIIVGMAAVTYLPRMLPLLLLHGVELPKPVKKIVDLLPSAILAALIFPAVIYANGNGSQVSSIVGAVTAIIMAWFGCNLMVTVIAAIATVYGAGLLLH